MTLGGAYRVFVAVWVFVVGFFFFRLVENAMIFSVDECLSISKVS